MTKKIAIARSPSRDGMRPPAEPKPDGAPASIEVAGDSVIVPS